MRTHSTSRTAALALLLILLATVSRAQAPGWSRGQQDLSVSYDECRRRSPMALEAEGYRIDYDAGAFSVGIKSVHTAVISCHPAPNGRMGVNIVVASNGEEGGVERERLQMRMAGATPAQQQTPGGTPPAKGAATIPWRESALGQGLRGTAGTRQPFNCPPNPAGQELGRVWGTDVYSDDSAICVAAVHAGVITMAGGGTVTIEMLPGQSSFSGSARNGVTTSSYQGGIPTSFRVIGGATAGTPPQAPPHSAAGAGRMLAVRVTQDRTAIVDWSNGPSNKESWVSVVPAGTADGVHAGKWIYTQGASSGKYASDSLPAGEYEARFFADGGYSKLIDRLRFSVSPFEGSGSRMLNVHVTADRHALVDWSNGTSDAGSWVSVVPTGTADSAHTGKWVYTQGNSSGRYDSGPLSPGEYEARFYGDDRYGKLLDRARFSVP